MFKANVGTTDRALRIFAGLLLVLLSVLNVIGPWGWAGLIYSSYLNSSSSEP
jgi:hypothetical protein